MTTQLTEATNPDHQLEIQVDSFEKLSTIRRIIGEQKGYEHPLTKVIMQDVTNSLNDNTGEFHNKIYFDGDAKEIYEALQEAAHNPDDKFVVEAANTLDLLPVTEQKAKLAHIAGRLAVSPDEAVPSVSSKEYDWVFADKPWPAREVAKNHEDTHASNPGGDTSLHLDV